jgi:HEPN domain-containing protein
VATRWADWYAQARHDLEQATASAEAGRYDWACFAAHQAAEKAVKALHLRQGQEAWGHVVARLLSALPEPVAAPADLMRCPRRPTSSTTPRGSSAASSSCAAGWRT